MINTLNKSTELPRLTKHKFISILAVTALLLSNPFVRAQSDGNQPAQNHLAGTWMSRLETGIAPNLLSFMSDGRAIWTRPVTVGPVPGPSLALLVGTGHGEWIRTGNHEFSATLFFLVSDLTTDFVNLVKVTATIKLNETSDELTQTGTLSILDTNGNLVFPPGPLPGSGIYNRVVAGQ